MPGIGSAPAGIGGAGSGPVSQSDRVLQPTPAAPKWDPATRQFPRNDDGTLVAIHPVDQQVALLLTIRQGTLKSTPTHGHRFDRLTRKTGAVLQRAAEDEVRLALAPVLRKGDITLGVGAVPGVQVFAVARGNNVVVVNYVNNRLKRPQSTSFALGG